MKGLESALLRMAVHGLAAAGDGDGDLATAAISGARESRENHGAAERRGDFIFSRSLTDFEICLFSSRGG